MCSQRDAVELLVHLRDEIKESERNCEHDIKKSDFENTHCC
jgi:hypothetical protein